MDEFEGIVQGGEFDRQRLMAYYFARTESQLGGCTMFAVAPACRSGGRGPIVGRNYDWATADLHWCELQRFDTDGAPRRIGYTHHWAGCADVLSAAGLYVAVASLPPVAVEAPGVQWNIIVDMLSETCATVDEAVRACSRVRHLRPMSYLLADSAGAVAVVEATPRQARRRGPEDGVVVAANAPQGGLVARDWSQQEPTTTLGEPILPEPPNYRTDALQRAHRRIQRALELLHRAAPRLTLQDVRAVLSDHEAPICTGDHSEPDGGRWATIWSGICEPAAGSFSIVPGLPCRHPYQAFSIAGL